MSLAAPAGTQDEARDAHAPWPLSWRASWRRWWQQRHPRHDRVLLAHGNVYILPTAAGWVFGLTLLVLLLASINYQLNLGYMLTFLLGGSAMMSVHLTHRTLRGLALHLRAPQPVHVGEAVVLEVVLDNPDARMRWGIGLRAKHRDQLHASTAPEGANAKWSEWVWSNVAACDSSTVRLSFAAQERGRHTLPTILIHTRFPFGLFRAWSIWRPAAEVLVYPRPETPPPPLPAQLVGSAGTQLQRQASSDEIDGVRDWRRGDPLHLIAWKKSTRTLASSGTLVSRERESRAQRDLWLDWAQAAPLAHEARLSRLTAWVWMADRAGYSYGLRLPGRECTPTSGDTHRMRCLEALALWRQSAAT